MSPRSPMTRPPKKNSDTAGYRPMSLVRYNSLLVSHGLSRLPSCLALYRSNLVPCIQVTVSRTTTGFDGYVWSVTFDTPTVIAGVANAGDQPAFYANGRMLVTTTSPSSSTFTVEVKIRHCCVSWTFHVFTFTGTPDRIFSYFRGRIERGAPNATKHT